MKTRTSVLALAATTVGLTAGVMFCYQIAIMPGIRRLPDPEFIRAFQNIDKEIVNPAFVVCTFLGAAAFLVAAVAMHRDEPTSRRFRLLVAATCLYLLGVVAVTMAGHVPKNEKLAEFPVASSTPQEAAAARDDFEAAWSRLHAVRTLASAASLVLVSGALLAGPGREAVGDATRPYGALARADSRRPSFMDAGPCR
jgi:uncharacterized membrane protein